MHAFFVTLVGLSLLCTTESRHFEPKDVTHDDDMVLIGGVPVYRYHQSLKYAHAEKSLLTTPPRESDAMNTTNESDAMNTTNESDVEDKLSWICVFDNHIDENLIEYYCPSGTTGEEQRPKKDTGVGIFKGCTEHGNVTDALGHHAGFPYLHAICSRSELEEALTHAGVLNFTQFCEGDSQVRATNANLDYSQYLIDDNVEAATWGLNRIHKDSAPAAGRGVHVYVLDTGVRTTHSQFEGRAVPQLESLGWVRKCECQNSTCAGDTHGHGTHCAGTIGGVNYGVAPQTRIHAVKVLADNGYGYTSWSIAAESWIKSNGMRPTILSMSLGGLGNNYAEKASIDALVEDGIVVVVAAGNEADDACYYNPAWVGNAITVGSTTSSDSLSWFSNYGTCVDILAPGSSILSAGHTSDTATSFKSGTSMACPHVSGAASILFALNPAMTPAQIITELTSEAESAISSLPSGTVNRLLQVDSISGR